MAIISDKVQGAWVMARAFAKAFDELASRGHPAGRVGHRLVPGVVCGAFAVELLLKCLLAEEGKEVRSHKPSVLFKRLDITNQEAVQSHFPRTRDREHVAEFLRGLDAAFVDWRYVYERGAVKLDFLLLLTALEALQATVLDRHPDWERLSD